LLYLCLYLRTASVHGFFFNYSTNDFSRLGWTNVIQEKLNIDWKLLHV